jgi:hypothetical protein
MFLIDLEEVQNLLSTNNISINGCFHVGSHECEELETYNNILGVKNENIVWIDALSSKVNESIQRGIPNVYHALISDRDDEDIEFNVSNNFQSSSILEFGTHLEQHPTVLFTHKIQEKSVTIDTFFERNNLDASKYNFWNIDIQGAELMALKGATKSIKYAKVLYLEVNVEKLYKNCALINEIDDFLAQFKFKRVITKMNISTPWLNGGWETGWGDAIYILET